MEKVERFNQAYEHLMNLGIVHKRKDVAEIMDVSEPNISRVFSGNPKYLTDRFLNRFNKAFNNLFNYDWLVSGEGEMLKATEAKPKSIGHAIGAAIGSGIAQSVTGINTAVAAAASPLGIGGVIGALFGNLLDTEEDITDDEAVEILKDALEDAKKTTKENEELKQEIEYWRQKANNLEYELSKSQTKVG